MIIIENASLYLIALYYDTLLCMKCKSKAPYHSLIHFLHFTLYPAYRFTSWLFYWPAAEQANQKRLCHWHPRLDLLLLRLRRMQRSRHLGPQAIPSQQIQQPADQEAIPLRSLVRLPERGLLRVARTGSHESWKRDWSYLGACDTRKETIPDVDFEKWVRTNWAGWQYNYNWGQRWVIE